MFFSLINIILHEFIHMKHLNITTGILRKRIIYIQLHVDIEYLQYAIFDICHHEVLVSINMLSPFSTIISTRKMDPEFSKFMMIGREIFIPINIINSLMKSISLISSDKSTYSDSVDESITNFWPLYPHPIIFPFKNMDHSEMLMCVSLSATQSLSEYDSISQPQ